MEIEDYPNYLIYNDGRVWSKFGKGRFLKQSPNAYGYRMVQLWNKNGGKNLLVHRLVAKAYIPNPDNHPTVDHINGIRDDNRIENLRWVTHSENVLNSDLLTSNTGFTYIRDYGKYSWVIRIFKLGFMKSYSKKDYTLEEVVFFRDMILND